MLATMQRGRLEQLFRTLSARVSRSLRPEQAASPAELVKNGVALSNEGRHRAAVRVFADVVARFGGDTAPDVEPEVARALVNKGLVLEKLGDPQLAIAAYAEVVTRHGDAPGTRLEVAVAAALLNKGSALHGLRHPDQAVRQHHQELAIRAWAEVVRRFGHRRRPFALRDVAARALLSQGTAQAELGRRDLAIQCWDKVVDQFQMDPEEAMQRHVAAARRNRMTAQP